MLLNSFASRITAAMLTGAAALVATPGYANSAAATDVSAPLRIAQDAKPAATKASDDQFRKLFSNWENLEKTSVPALAAVGDAAPAAGRVNLISGVRVSGTLPYTGTSGARIAALPFRSLSNSNGASVPSRTPIEGFRFTSEYGMREHPVLGGVRMHKGVDLAAPIGTAVYATADGMVEKAEWFGGYGLFVAVDHGGSLETRYGHMSRLNVAAGQMVHKGQVLGYVGMTGRTTGPHLHYEVRVAGEAVNPLPYMQQSNDIGRTRLALASAKLPAADGE